MATNALYRAPTVDNAVYETFGMQPGMDRLNLLPRHDAKLGWIAPNALYQIARAIVSPSVAAHGGYVSPEDGVNFAGNVSLGSLGTSALMKRPAPGPGRTVAQTVYHGSPHNFDKFDMSKIGTGEGAQAYGHGLYVAENPNVAKSYSVISKYTPSKADLSEYYKPGNVIRTSAGSTDRVLNYDPAAGYVTVERTEFGMRPRKVVYGDMSADPREVASALGKKPNLYHVDLPDQHIANMLDWDKPLSQQPPNVKEAAMRYMGVADGGLPADHKVIQRPNGTYAVVQEKMAADGKNTRLLLRTGSTQRYATPNEAINAYWDGMTGKTFYETLSRDLNDPAAASDYLNQIGIPGIRYLDGSSRGAGDGTRNYVVFDDKLLKILSKE